MVLVQMPTQVIKICHFHDGWRVYCDNDDPYFVGPGAIEHAIAFARQKAKSASVKICLMASDGKLISRIPGKGRRRGGTR